MPRKRLPDYLKRAKKSFLQGLWSPVEAILAGKHTLEEWVDIVAFEPDLERQTQSRWQQYSQAARAFNNGAKDLS